MVKTNYGQFNRPVSAFVTFSNQEAKEKCNKYYYEFDPITGKANKDFKGLSMDDIQLEVVSAPEPTDVIYENFEITKEQVHCNEIFLYLYLTIAVIAAALVFVFLKLKSGKNNLMYPATFDCNSVYSLFGTEVKGHYSKASFTEAQKLKFKEYAMKDHNNTKDMVGGGFYQCYCTTYKDYMGYAKGKKDICNSFIYDKFYGYFLTGCVSVLINAVNYGLSSLTEF